MKKVLIFSLGYFPKHVGGAEVAIQEKTARMPEYEFHLVCLRYDSTLPKEEKIGNVFVHRIGFTRANPSMADLRKFPLHFNKFLFQFLAAWEAVQLHRAERFDATWAMMAHSCGVPAALFKMFYPRVPYVLELQEGDPPEYIERKMRVLWPLFSRAFTSADVVSVISTFLGRWAKRRGYPGEPILVPNAVNTKHFSQEYSEQTIDDVRDRLGKKMGDVFLITTSRLVHKNAVDDVIKAIPSCPANVHFIILGIGPDEAALRALAKKTSVESRVQFIGQIGHADLPQYLKACDIFIRASRSEGMGNSFVEAMAAGLPVIATQEGGIADFLFDEVRNPDKPITGWAVDSDSPAQIADAVKRIMENPEKTRRVIATAKAMVMEKYDWDLIARDMKEKVFAPLFSQRG
jgi:glycosyltransferase involved in cell wall biosynthesis